jgi:hypothetical protein
MARESKHPYFRDSLNSSQASRFVSPRIFPSEIYKTKARDGENRLKAEQARFLEEESKAG